ncbi:MAG: ribonuclease P protein component [Tissierellia bacterium]|nr:ribonuclease P protein component [Tissierellia bacterium]
MKTASLTSNQEFKEIYRRADSKVTKYFVVYYRLGTGDRNRVGFTVSKKIGNAVVRNRARRRLKECFRMHEDILIGCYDLVIVARARSSEGDFHQMCRLLKKVLQEIQR